MKDKFLKFMRGRYVAHYGIDELSYFLIILLFILGILFKLFFRDFYIENYKFFNALNYTILIIIYFRLMSKNLNQRYLENRKFVGIINPIRNIFKNTKRAISDRENKYIKCENCKKTLRVPRKKGKIKVKCKNCGHTFIVRT